MKIIEAMKELKRLKVKLDDLRSKIQVYAADMDYEQPTYPDQRAQVSEWVQSAEDTLKRMLELRVAITRTNLQTGVTIELGGKQVTKSIAEWIHRRKDLANNAQTIWGALTPGMRRDGVIKLSNNELKDAKVRVYFDPKQRDAMVAMYRDEPSIIDGTLEVVNATTDLVELPA